MPSGGANPMIDLEPFDEESGALNVIIDTPKGSRNKFKYDEKSKIFKLVVHFHSELSFLLTSFNQSGRR